MNSLKSIVLRILCGKTASGPRAAMVLGVVLAICPTSAFPETQVRGSPEAVWIEAKNSSIEEILTALSNSFGLHYRSTVKLEKQINGNYRGTLERVLARILEGNDFVLKTIGTRIEIAVLMPKKVTLGAAISSPTPAPPALTLVPTGVAETSVPIAPPTVSAFPTSKDAKTPPGPTSLPAPFLVAEGPALTPTPPPGSPVPILEPVPSATSPPTPGSVLTQVLEPTPTTIAPPTPLLEKPNQTPTSPLGSSK